MCDECKKLGRRMLQILDGRWNLTPLAPGEDTGTSAGVDALFGRLVSAAMMPDREFAFRQLSQDMTAASTEVIADLPVALRAIEEALQAMNDLAISEMRHRATLDDPIARAMIEKLGLNEPSDALIAALWEAGATVVDLRDRTPPPTVRKKPNAEYIH